MRTYKLVVMLPSTLKKEQKTKIVADVEKWAGDVKVKTFALGEKKLAYKIRGAQSADYVLFELEGESIAKDLVTRMENSDDIMRQLVVRMS